MKLQEYLIAYKDASLATCILYMRRIQSLDSNEVQQLHEFLWSKQKDAAKHFEY